MNVFVFFLFCSLLCFVCGLSSRVFEGFFFRGFEILIGKKVRSLYFSSSSCWLWWVGVA